MSHVDHLAKNKELLTLRFEIIRFIREFFWQDNFLEVETPLILRLPGQEPYLSPMKLTVHDEKGKEYTAFLHTSPEYTMKKMLAVGFDKIFFLGKTFRDYESFGGTHNPEFTMIEWYRAGEDMTKIMEDAERLFQYLTQNLVSKLQKQKSISYQLSAVSSFRRIHMRDLWREHVGVNLDEYLNIESMRQLCVTIYDLRFTNYESYEDLFYKIFLNKIEPKLTEPTIVHHYPAQMAALARLSPEDSRYAERFEVYMNGMELANAFTELTDAGEQLRRLEKERGTRLRSTSYGGRRKDVFDIDPEFIEAVRRMPPSAGIALGVDRLMQAVFDYKEINDLLPLPLSMLTEELK